MFLDFRVQTILLCQCAVEKLIMVQLRPKSESGVHPVYLVLQTTFMLKSCIDSIHNILDFLAELSIVLKLFCRCSPLRSSLLDVGQTGRTHHFPPRKSQCVLSGFFKMLLLYYSYWKPIWRGKYGNICNFLKQSGIAGWLGMKQNSEIKNSKWLLPGSSLYLWLPVLICAPGIV